MHKSLVTVKMGMCRYTSKRSIEVSAVMMDLQVSILKLFFTRNWFSHFMSKIERKSPFFFGRLSAFVGVSGSHMISVPARTRSLTFLENLRAYSQYTVLRTHSIQGQHVPRYVK